MARINPNEVDKYGGQGGAGFFQLKDDGDVAQVRFMYDTVEDIVCDVVHEVETGKVGKNGRPITQYVDCLRRYDEPVDKCPFCREGKYTMVRLIIPMYNMDDKKVQIWDRGGKTWSKKLSKMAARYPHLVSQVFEVERNGEKGDQQTDYSLYPIEGDKATLDDLPPLPEIHGPGGNKFIWDKSAEDMEYYLEQQRAGETDIKKMFPPTGDEDDDEEEEAPVRRRSRNREEAPEGGRRRRTPGNNNEESF